MVGLRHEARRRVGEYSKGMARRIGLAQALINDPEFLILDEPTSGLDPIGARQIKDVIRSLGRKGKTILLSSHILADVEDVCDRVTILYGGQQRAAGDIAELLRQRDVTQITTPPLAEETIAQVRDLIQRLEQKDIVGVSNPRVKLEDFFLKIVEEAQAANIRTSGARKGGEIPDFLQKATDAPRELVASLVEAALRKTEALPVEPLRRDEEPAREVIDDLLGRKRPESRPGETAPVKAPAAPEPERRRERSAADRNVIDALLGKPDGSPNAEADKKSGSS
jgi:ABC-2 type transport system ATP-binding protein